jgi:quercetin dioxygenase-like cupin family protein
MSSPAVFLRLFTDDGGDTHFEEVEVAMSPVQYAPPAPAVDLSDPLTASRVSWFRFPAGWIDEAHPSPRRQLFVVLSGQVEGWTSTGDTRRFGPGSCLLMDDTTGKGHGARPIGGDASAIVIALGSDHH